MDRRGVLLHGDVGDRRDCCRFPPLLSSTNCVQGFARGADALLLMPRTASGTRSRGGGGAHAVHGRVHEPLQRGWGDEGRH